VRALTLPILFALAPFALCSEVIRGQVVGVSDGDTIRVLREVQGKKEELRIRLWGIDCPEDGQPYSKVAKQFTSDAVFKKPVSVEVKDTDRYGRKVGIVSYDVQERGRTVRKSLNLELVRAGLAWWYTRYAPAATDLRDAEREARAARRGLWKDANPVAPWEWRRRAEASNVRQNVVVLFSLGNEALLHPLLNGRLGFLFGA
jgi:micrococcal nuclease